MIPSLLGTAILAALGFWLFGGFALRTGGALLVLAGAVGLASTGDANGLLLVALGAVLWWAGHLHYALRRGAWKSALAQRLFDGVVYAWGRIGQKTDGPSPGADLRVLPGGGRTRGDDEPGGG
jgi:hypothetical protein